MTHRMKSIAAAVAIAITSALAAEHAVAATIQNHAERVYAGYATANSHAVSFEIETLAEGPMSELAGRPYSRILEAPSYLVRSRSAGPQFELPGLRTTPIPASRYEDSSVDEFTQAGRPLSSGRYRLLAVIVSKGEEVRSHDALELCWSDQCVLLDPSIEFGDVRVAEKSGAVIMSTTTPGLSTKRSELLAAHNAKRRTKCGSNSLTMTTNANEAAVYHAKDMATENYFSHDSRNPFERWYDRIDRFVTRPVGGENIAYGYSTVSGVMEGWMNSDGHRRNIMDCSFKYVGFGYAENNGRRYWVADFTY